ncbi:YibE/F family protein [Actinomadura rugatobispora]|uniref:YibE/F family protein n=1 Tax=Actinomadura rugatobispora TaxID=1994 RepID=A0ABW1ACM8_9ACTN|nr:YibE/F family protein [Actinomadura rugatobispora]
MHAHAHGHSHGGPSDPTVVRAVLAVIVPLAVATLAALLWMWPGEVKAGGTGAEGMTKVGGTIVDIDLKPCPRPAAPPGAWPAAEPGAAPRPTDPRRCGNAHVRMEDGAQAGRVVTVALPDGPGTQTFATGDDVVLLHLPGGGPGAEPGPEGSSPYQLSDHDRSTGLWLIGAAFALAVVAFGRWRGLTALVGLAVTFGLLLTFLIPAILNGSPPLAVAIVCAAAIMLAVLYLTHGFSVATSIAVIGTLASLALTGLLAWLSIRLTHLSGITDDSSLNLDLGYQISTQGLLLASIIIGSLGVLDDVTVTQSVTVTELARANPSYGFGRLYRAAARVGRAHIASVINTIILAYAGASLPLMLLFTVGRQPLGEVVTGPIIAQEIVRGAAGTVGLIAAVPITTALAAFAVSRRAARDAEAPAVPQPAGSGM